MKNDELRDLFVAHLMSGKVNDFYTSAQRKNIAMMAGEEEWVQQSAEEATNERIEKTATVAYRIADALIIARYKL